MILDSEAQRNLLLAIFDATTFQGNALKEAFLLRAAIEQAQVRSPNGIIDPKSGERTPLPECRAISAPVSTDGGGKGD